MNRSDLKSVIKNNKIAVFTVFAYVAFFIYSPPIGIDSLFLTSDYLVEMLEILPAVFVITGLVEVWVPKETIMKTFGKDAGIKGRLISVLIGSFSAGPIYAAFPVTYTLLKKGSSISNIVIILSAWAVIKAPMLVVETKFMGLSFMLTRYFLTVPAVIGIGMITEKAVEKAQIVKQSSKDDLVIDKITDELPGYNCGACGYNSCKEAANAVVEGDEKADICDHTDDETNKNIRKIAIG